MVLEAAAMNQDGQPYYPLPIGHHDAAHGEAVHQGGQPRSGSRVGHLGRKRLAGAESAIAPVHPRSPFPPQPSPARDEHQAATRRRIGKSRA